MRVIDTGRQASERGLLSLWFSFVHPVGRRTYFWHGLALMLFKYGVDAGVLYHYIGKIWTPWDYFIPVWSARQQIMAQGPEWLTPAMVIFSLPFLWIGISMSARRAVDSGQSAWLALLFFLPVINVGLMLALSLLPSKPPQFREDVDQRLQSAMLGLAVVVGDTLLTMAVAIYFRHQYSTGLFLGLPFTLGYITAYTYSRRDPEGTVAPVGLALTAVTVAGGAVILFALEGLICTVMALPIAWGIAIPGALLGRAVATGSFKPQHGIAAAVLFLPLLVAVEPRQTHPSREIVTVVEIAAPPDVVWKNVVTFELAPPTEVTFRLGLSAPIRARIDGSGVGAVRYCDFTTGTFREPVTAWEENRLLGFDIVEQAPPMRELSPYEDIQPPHLKGYFRATRGEFRLIPLEGGRTRLVGSTRFQVDMGPNWYWTLFADQIVETIHQRVLHHIQRVSEG